MIFLEFLLIFYFFIGLVTKYIDKKLKYLTLAVNLVFGIVPLGISYVTGERLSPILIEWLYYGFSLYHLAVVFLDVKMKKTLIRKSVYGFGLIGGIIIIISSYLTVLAEGY